MGASEGTEEMTDNRIGDTINEIGERVLARLEATNSARERALAETRQIVRMSANAIRAVHRDDFDEAARLVGQAREMKDALVAELREHPNIYWSGYVQDAQKEYAEANIVLGIISGRGVPSPEDLSVENAVYLNGLGEAAGELRRYVLDALRRWQPERAETLLVAMDDIYGLLVTVDYPDAITGGLRRTTDMVRGVLERTRGDLTVALQNRSLLDALERAEARAARGGE
ncbi:MAG TPA: haloacid dehalogenase [Thermomicrobiales bacterium]|nr:haloacid dehalogenase [Thermomicrobiales bacterium]